MDVGSNLSEKAQQDFKLVLKAIDGDQKAYADLLADTGMQYTSCC
jgi:hypothetical protein